jgi:hypothetical protein
MGCGDFHGSVNDRFIIIVGPRQHNSTIDARRSGYWDLATPLSRSRGVLQTLFYAVALRSAQTGSTMPRKLSASFFSK